MMFVYLVFFTLFHNFPQHIADIISKTLEIRNIFHLVFIFLMLRNDKKIYIVCNPHKDNFFSVSCSNSIIEVY